MNVSPSTAFEAVASGFDTGLTGTLGVRLLDNAGATTTARVTAGIAEYPAGSGIYYKSLATPAAGMGQLIFWDTGTIAPGNVAVENLNVDATALAPWQTLTVWAQWPTSGLVGTLGVRIVDNAGNTTTARTTSGITEPVSGSGVYRVPIVVPSSDGQFGVVFDDGTSYAIEDFTVGGVPVRSAPLTPSSLAALVGTAVTAGSVTVTAGSVGSTTLTPVTSGTLILS